ncbi:methyl-accepting chemotaxis protein [Marinobacterium arenosum]|uniref:methyl-accepting chemotaxis protein n=1 Tax=Marinobacterium arenosum TaxID=2862496 RepID=UPI001C97155C|nr:methyl-accepting chemotaxis protein [Marinobacterium arenosum]MBY4678105.1 methyl-accepting chemotaxis protein [Marinobacterium arenosum]
MTQHLSKLSSRLLRPILFAVIAIILVQVAILLSVTRSSVSDLVDQVVTTLNDGGSQMSARLDSAGQNVGSAIQQLSVDSGRALTQTLQTQLSQEQQNVEKLLVSSVQETANAMAQLMAVSAPDAIWDRDTPALTKLVRMLHRNPDVVFARYYDMEGQPLTRYLDKRKPKIKELLKNGKGKGSMNKVIDAAKRDPSIYMVEVDINPRGAVIGRFLLAVSNEQATTASQQLSQRFDSLISGTRDQVKQVIDQQANQAKGVLQQAIAAASELNRNTNRQTGQEIEQASSDLLQSLTMILIGLGVLMVLILVAIMTARITSKLVALTGSLQELAAGEGDLTKRIDLHSNDEIGDMAGAINSFIGKTQQLVQQANSAAENTALQINTINSVSSDASNAVERQNQQVHQVSEAMTEMVQTINQVAERIQHNLSNVDQIRQAGHEASEISADVKGTIGQLAGEVASAAEVINGVAEQSSQITTILEMISGVAEQTNLLALNAAIEAARAGDKGRGFAVVADEVRDLASKTQASTEDIHRQIEALQSGVQGAVKVIGAASSKADASIAAINGSDERIQSISDAVQRLFDFTNEIAAMAEQQSQVSSEVNQSIERISDDANLTAQSVQQNAQAAEQLDQLARSLKTTLAQFKV